MKILLTGPRPTGAAQTRSPDGQWRIVEIAATKQFFSDPQQPEAAEFLPGDHVY